MGQQYVAHRADLPRPRLRGRVVDGQHQIGGHAPTTSNKEPKWLLRTLIADITLLPETDRDKVRIGIRWHTGGTDEIAVARATHPGTAKRSPSPAVAMVTRLGPTAPTAEHRLAARLGSAGPAAMASTPRHDRPSDGHTAGGRRPMPKSPVSQTTVFGAQRPMLRTLHD